MVASGTSSPPAARSVPCPDCPGYREGMLESLIRQGGTSCAFRNTLLEGRNPIPVRWFQDHLIAFVRRGILVRQRSDANGRVTSVDIAGPGSLLALNEPVSAASASVPCGYAVGDAIVCLLSRDTFEHALESEHRVARDIVRLQQKAIERMTRIADARGRPTLESRVAALICALADTLSATPHRDRLPAELQLRDIGALLGIRHESVCRGLRVLTERDYVRRTRAGIRLIDRAALEVV